MNCHDRTHISDIKIGPEAKQDRRSLTSVAGKENPIGQQLKMRWLLGEGPRSRLHYLSKIPPQKTEQKKTCPPSLAGLGRGGNPSRGFLLTCPAFEWELPARSPVLVRPE